MSCLLDRYNPLKPSIIIFAQTFFALLLWQAKWWVFAIRLAFHNTKGSALIGDQRGISPVASPDINTPYL